MRDLLARALSLPATTTIELVQRFRHMRALVIGDAMLDTYLEGSASRLCSEGPVPVVRKTAEYRIPGGAANTAANLRALEADVMLLGVVGRDLAGSLLRKALKERGISDRWLIEDETATTLHKLRILADGQYVVRFDEGGQQVRHNASPYSASCLEALLSNLRIAYTQCDVVVVSDYSYGVLSEPIIQLVQTLQLEQPKTLLVDSKSLQRFRSIPASIVTPNLLEACLLVDEPVPIPHTSAPDGPEGLGAIEHIGRRLLALLKTEAVAITLAEQGVLLLDRNEQVIHLPAHPVAQASDVGAGDSFAAALALAMAAGGSIVESAQIALDAAGIAVTMQHTAVVSSQALLQRVSVREYTTRAYLRDGAAQESLTHLAALLDAERAAGRSVVLTNGIFDILHAGHMQFLRQAKALGDMLVVGINSDQSVRQLKGAGRPINNERDRMALVAALDVVDHVVLFSEETPSELIRLLRPAIHVKGGDYAEGELPEAEAVQEVGGRVVILPLAGSMSTSAIIQRIVTFAFNEQEAPTLRRNP